MHTAALKNMVDSQLLTNEITDNSLLDAVFATPRENFVPTAFKNAAYADNNIPLGHKRALMCPLTLARMLQHASITKNDKVLHIGVGLGYVTALLVRLSRQVIGVESQHDLLEAARENFLKNSVNVGIFNACLTVGYPLSAPFDVIFIEGAVRQIPTGLLDQLAEGGRLICIKSIQTDVTSLSGMGRIEVLTKKSGTIRANLYQDVSAVLLPGFEKKTEFNF